MAGLSVLIFSKDDTRQAIALAREVHSLADEIVLMDASGPSDKAYANSQKRALNLSKLRIFDVVALGYREPLMSYAFTKCRNRWVLYFDADERPSDDLKRDARRLISDKMYDAYAVGVYSVRSETDRNFTSWQFMLFRKDRIEFRGLLHERPIVHGRFRALGPEYRINQMVTGMVHSTGGRYAEMERFQRYTYAQHNLRVLEQLGKVGDIEGASRMTASKRFVLTLLRIYEALGMKRQDQEVSNLDYWSFWLARTVAHQTRRGSASGVLAAFRDSLGYAMRMRGWRKGPHSDEDFEIAQQIYKFGVTKFLRLDSPGVVERITRKYAGKQQGVELLIRLLRERYRQIDREKFIL
ncbi:MAG: hypothetical protein KGH98_01310 [Candidatus Micrarchaeota archaeon]|nr:hypothetical protein [Candidatus Micrarchaeota archaeon]